MTMDRTNLECLAGRAGFNAALRYMRKASAIAARAGDEENLADILYRRNDEALQEERCGLLLQMLLVEKLRYKTASINLAKAVTAPESLALEFARWNNVDIVVAYHHPDAGLLAANPKVREQLLRFGALRKRELLVAYVGRRSHAADDCCAKAACLVLALFEGKRPAIPAELYQGPFAASRPDQSPVIAKGGAKMTSRYAVVVSNELFHNGNVEAWKRIIASYTAKHPDIQVSLYYEGERISTINALFTWGKVKHGSAIEFALASKGGSEIQDAAKLQRYLAAGASSRYEDFLAGPMNTALNLKW
ncbi:hypothetical protein ACYULU_02910 [Breznakiellaceae bacterium SP9]